MRVLVLGGGGREHALCWAINGSADLAKLWCAPGNAGIADVAECVTLDIENPAAVTGFCADHAVDLLVIGPEAPLEAGVSDAARKNGILVFGPSRAAAMLETSKAFTKAICDACDAPTASYVTFDNAADAKTHVEATGAPVVVKADGLAAGKGVIVAETVPEAMDAIESIFDGPGGGSVVLEEKLIGEEASFFVLTDGTAVMPLAGAQDHKRVHDNDEGPNTGGMGAYSPAPAFTEDMAARTMETIVRPILTEMSKRGTPYSGVLYVGLMLTKDGPKLIEINARFGDPECQCILPRLQTDVLTLLNACATKTLTGHKAEWSKDTCLTVVMAAKGYPGSYARGDVISGLADAADEPGALVFHAGTKAVDGTVQANGGRVLGITATGRNAAEARERAYRAVGRVKWENGFCRSDIGWRAL